MADRPNFKRGLIIGARMAGACVTKTAKLFGVARSTIPKVMTAFEIEEKILLTEIKRWKKAKAVW